MKKTREDWLNRVASDLAPLFEKAGAPLPPKVRLAIGFPSTGDKGKRIGECWDKTASGDATFEILIRPDCDDPAEVVAIVAHELVHSAVGIKAGHGPAFRRVAKSIGLAGRMTATVAGPDFIAAVAPILKAAGPLPHARLRFGRSPEDNADDPDILTTRPKRQKNRHNKCTCTECGYTVRVAKKWVDLKGPPLCPDHGPMLPEQPTEDDTQPDE